MMLPASVVSATALLMASMRVVMTSAERTWWARKKLSSVEEEVDNTPSHERRSRVKSMLSGAQSTVALTAAAVTRAKELQTFSEALLTTGRRWEGER